MDSSEIWKDVSGYEGSYQISNFGRARSLAREIIRSNGWPYTVVERVLKKTGTNGIRYPFHREGKTNIVNAGRLVYSAFVGELNTALFVLHKNGDENDNRSENLIQGTQLDVEFMQFDRKMANV